MGPRILVVILALCLPIAMLGQAGTEGSFFGTILDSAGAGALRLAVARFAEPGLRGRAAARAGSPVSRCRL